MRLVFGYFFTVFLICLCTFCPAQTSSSIRGNVLLQNKAAAEAATVVLLNLPDSSVSNSTLVNENGTFEFSKVAAGIYMVLITRLGYKKEYSPAFRITKGLSFTLKTVVLTATSSELKEVTVVSKKPYVEVKPGKMTINPQASITADGKSVLDILRQSPGVRVDNNDNVSISGRQNVLILIDGKATSLTGADLAALLRSTQGSNIDRMELITGGSAKYDASAGGIINIIYKKGKNIGTNGTFNASAGYGAYYKANTGISFNSRAKNYNIFGNYSIAGNKTYHDIYTDRTIPFAGIISNYNSTYKNIQESLNHNFRLGTDFFLNSDNTIGFLVSGYVSNNDFAKHNTLKISNQGVLDSTIAANSAIDRNINNINFNVNYTGKLDKSGKTLAANVTYTQGKRQSDEYITNSFFDDEGNQYRNPLLLQNISPTKMHNWTGLLDYTNPLPNNASVDAGLKISHTVSDNNLIFGPKAGDTYTIDPAYSNYFVYTESVGAGYINYNGKFDKFDLEAGLRGEYTRSDGNSVTLHQIASRKYFNLFPDVILNYRHNDKNEYALSFSRGITRPSYDRLNPFLYFIDLYNFQAGNANLKPEYNNTLKLTHTYNQETVTSLYINYVTGGTFPFYEQNNATKVNLATSVNLGRVFSYGVNLNTPFIFTFWWSSRYDIDASYQRYIAYAQYGNLNKGTGDLIIQSNQNFTISKTIAAEVSGRYETSTFYGINQIKPNYYVNAGISKQILNKLGKLSLNAEDIFKTNRDRAFTNYQNLNRSLLDRREYRKVLLSFSYRFGKTSVKGESKHATGNESEQRRMRLNN